jgi:hypothetical protein
MVTSNIPTAARTSAEQKAEKNIWQKVSFWRLHAVIRNYG